MDYTGAEAEGQGEAVSSSHYGASSSASASSCLTCLPVDFPERLQALHQQEICLEKRRITFDFSKLLLEKQLQQHCSPTRQL